MKYTIFLLIALSFTSCTKDEALQAYHTLTIRQGEHRAKPWALKLETDGTRTYEWQFTHTVRYELGDSDQCDWNKLTGASADLLQTRDNSIMVAWRYDRSDSVVLSVYYHADGETFWASAPCTDPEPEVLRVDSELPYIVIPATEPFRTSVRVTGNTIAVDVETIFTGQRMTYEREFSRIGRHREIYPWFGGNRTAPHDIEIGRRLVKNQ